MAFLLEADKVKQVERRNLLADGSRRENDAEHCWHAALMALVLAEHANEKSIDLFRVIKMLLIHDLVEIDAGDTYIYDEAGRQSQKAREAAAADRLFALLPEEQGRAMRELWEEFEAKETPEARFAGSMDRINPLLLNHAAHGKSWKEHGTKAEQIRAVNRAIADGSQSLWKYASAVIDDAVARGMTEAEE